MRIRLFQKYFYAISAIITISLSFLIIISSVFFFNFLTADKKGVLKETCTAFSDMATGTYNLGYEFTNMVTVVTPVLTRAIDVDIIISDTNGSVTYCSCKDWNYSGECRHSGLFVPESVLSGALKGEINLNGTLNGIYEEERYIMGQPLKNYYGDTIGVVLAASSFTDVREYFSYILRIFLFVGIGIILVMFFVVYYITFRLTRPILMMSDAAKSIANGDFSKRIPVTSEDEVGQLATAFNNMTDSLSQLEGMRRSFIGNVSHELKTPMTTIGGFIDGIIDGTIDKDKQEYYLKIVSEEVKRLSRIVQSMLSLAKIESGTVKINPSEINLSDMLINIMISQEQRIIEKNISVEGLEFVSGIKITADKDLIYQVIYNLVDNAIKFTDESGTVTFNSGITENGGVYLGIKNSGKGIEKKDLPHVFERFYKTDRSRSAVKDSTGLGLYIVKTIIDVHKGTITVKSKPDEYTEFIITLPPSVEEDTLKDKRRKSDG